MLKMANNLNPHGAALRSPFFVYCLQNTMLCGK